MAEGGAHGVPMDTDGDMPRDYEDLVDVDESILDTVDENEGVLSKDHTDPAQRIAEPTKAAKPQVKQWI